MPPLWTPSSTHVQARPDIDPDGTRAWWSALNAPDDPNVRWLRTLAEQGFDVNTVDHKGQTGLHQAAQNSHLELVELLLSLGADPNRCRPSGMTVLHDAAGILRPADIPRACAIIDRLIDHGVPVNQPIGPGGVAHGASALWLATYNDQAALVRHLIRCGAEPNPVNAAGTSARTIAQEQGSEDVLDVLIQAEQQALARAIDVLSENRRDRPRL